MTASRPGAAVNCHRTLKALVVAVTAACTVCIMWQHAKRGCQLLPQLVLVLVELLLRTMVWLMNRGTRSQSVLKADVVPVATLVVALPALWLLRPALLGPATACHVPSADDLVHRCYLQCCFTVYALVSPPHLLCFRLKASSAAAGDLLLRAGHTSGQSQHPAGGS